MGAGAAEGAVDASNILKPSPRPGRNPVHRRTTLDDYRKYVERDPAWNAGPPQPVFEDPTATDH